MLEGLKDALEHVEGLARENEKTEVIEICGHTYANKNLKRYDNADKAGALEASSLTALIDYIGACYGEFPKDTDMIIHIVNPKRVRLISALDAERTRECLFEVKAEVNEFRFGHWYDHECLLIVPVAETEFIYLCIYLKQALSCAFRIQRSDQTHPLGIYDMDNHIRILRELLMAGPDVVKKGGKTGSLQLRRLICVVITL